MNDILNLLNTISQIVIAISSVVAIIIAIRQIRHKGIANLKLSYSYGMGLYKHADTERSEVIAGINIKIINLGLSPIYIEYCGLQFINKKRDFDRPGIMTEYSIVKINPGESFDGSIPHVEILLNDLDDKVSLHDKVYIYVQLCNGKIYRVKTDEDYASFKHEFLKVARKAENKNNHN